ncbi:DUF3307 domain-containing protein [Chromohalobacter sp. 48-RD10]|uniref:DUF3307 domain-containing protein n=1 Tax=Chromohalobacter sp. 48-RD10 TaxID=2994063 RepID=UPI00246954D7|nr:DUF3307 domain-containing protein [Chromohalobacter sp. 48-RD10]
MIGSPLTTLLLLLIAHLAGDFLLQSAAWVRDKNARRQRSRALYLHAGVHGALAWLVFISSQSLATAMLGAVFIAVTHLVIDAFKTHAPAERIRYFVVDQALHVTVLVITWAWLVDDGAWLGQAIAWLLHPRTLLVALAYLIVMRPFSILIALIMRRWSHSVDNSGTLADAGARIGMLERFLVLTFVLAGQLVPIGFLLAAKSVLRFGDLREDRDRKLTEYVLLGTMLSFSLTLTLGILIAHWYAAL